MIKSNSPRILLAIIASVFVFVACSKDEEDVAVSSALSSDATLLQYVPADTPYVFANVAPLPDDLMDKIEPKIDRVLQSYQTVLREVMQQAREDVSEDELSSEDQERIAAVADQLMTLLSVEGMRSAGLGREATGAIYGNGLLPVVRLELTDGALFDAAIADLESEGGYELDVATLGEYTYRYIDAERFRFIIAVLDDQAVLTLVPADSDDAQTSRALGITLPDSNIAESGALQNIAAEYGFTDEFVGFFDVASIVDRLTGGATGLDADLVAMMDHDPAEISDVCRAEIGSVAAISPRLVMGYKKVSVDQIDSAIVLELRDDIASGLQGLSAAVPGLGEDHGGLMSFGLGVDIKAAREFVEARLDAIEAAPFECELFAELQAGVAGGREALNQPVPPMVYDFKGFLAVIDDIQGLDIASQTPPTSVDGSFLLAMNNAQALVSLGTMFSPELAELNLQADGKPVALQLPQVQAMGIDAFAVLSDDAIAISVGDGAEAELEGMISAEAAAEAPFVSFSMDASRYYGFLGDAIAAGEADSEDAPSPKLQAALNEIMVAVADVYDRMSADVRFTPRGVEIDTSVTLKD
jgi:hypothetical protein